MDDEDEEPKTLLTQIHKDEAEKAFRILEKYFDKFVFVTYIEEGQRDGCNLWYKGGPIMARALLAEGIDIIDLPKQ